MIKVLLGVNRVRLNSSLQRIYAVPANLVFYNTLISTIDCAPITD